MRISKRIGLVVSDNVLTAVRKELTGFKNKGGYVDVGAFTNGRECGYTYLVTNSKSESFTWCTYEHRNSDQIIINGRPGYKTMADELPYKSDSKWDYIKAFDYDQSASAGEFLAKEIKKFLKK